MPLLALSLWASPLAAQDLQGTWKAGVTTMNVKVESWGGDCGPEPKSSRSKGGGTVSITEEDKHLVIQGKDHVVRTNRCWSRNPAMRRLSSSFVSGVWTTRCRTPTDDPREEEGTYVIKQLGDGKLEYRDVSRYNWRLNNSSCVATITTVQSLLRTSRTPSRKPPPAAPEPGVDDSDDEVEPDVEDDRARAASGKPACVPGPPARMSLRPEQAELSLGGRLCLRPRVVDAKGCRVRNPSVQYRLSHSPALKARMERSCFVAAASAAEAEGTFKVVATAGDARASAQIDVRSIDLSGLIALRLETGGVMGFDEDEEEATPEPGRPATRVSTGPALQGDDDATRLVVVAVGSLAVLALLGVWLVVRRRGSAATAVAHDSGPSDPPAPRQASAATPATPIPSAPPVPDETWICPTCRHGYPARRRVCPSCPEGANQLIPYAEFNQRARQQQSAVKRCRDCGEEVAASANFCGHCGSRSLEDGDR